MKRRNMKKKFLTKNIKVTTVSEATTKPVGLSKTENIQKQSKKFNDAGLKDGYTKLADIYDFDDGEEDALEDLKKYTREDDLEAYEIAAKGAGKMHGLKYDNADTEIYDEFEKRNDEINDHSEYEKEFGTHDGFGEGKKENNTYDELKKRGKDYIKHKYEDEYVNTPKVRTTKNESTMKRLNFKQEFKDEDHMLSLIKESYKVDGNVFLMSDGNQSYKVRWDGDKVLGEGISLLYKNDKMITESKDMMKKLFDYKTSDVVGKTNNYISETVEFNKMMDIVREGKGLVSEQDDNPKIDELSKRVAEIERAIANKNTPLPSVDLDMVREIELIKKTLESWTPSGISDRGGDLKRTKELEEKIGNIEQRIPNDKNF